MATIAGDAPYEERSLFVRKATGLVRGLVVARRVHLRDVLDQPDHARPLHLLVRAVHPEGQPAAGGTPLGRVPGLPDDRVRLADRGDAASGRGLRLGQPRHRRRRRLRARGLRLVVHQLALGADLREHPQVKEFFQPLAAIVGWNRGVSFWGEPKGVFTASVITAFLAAAFISIGMRGYAKAAEDLLLRRRARPR